MSTTIEWLPAGYTARHATLHDASAVAALIAACQEADSGAAEMSTEELLEQWKNTDLASETILIAGQSGKLAAYADLLNRRYTVVSIYGYVHPDQRGRGLGASLVAWGERWTHEHIPLAPAGASVIVQHYILSSNEAARRLLEERGYQAARTIYWMERALQPPLPEPQWPEGVVVRSFTPGQDERAAYEAYEEASREVWNRPRNTFERWESFTRNADPELIFIAEEPRTGEIASVCVTSVVGGQGNVGGFGVRRPWRRKGLGLAMLYHAFGEFYRRGARRATLSVDSGSTTNAPNLYLRAGMHVVRSYIVYQKDLRPGIPFTDLPDEAEAAR